MELGTDERYNVQDDEQGRLFDLRNTDEFTSPLRIKEYPTANVDLIVNEYSNQIIAPNQGYYSALVYSNYIYGLDCSFSQITNSTGNYLYHHAKSSKNSQVLTDKKGYCLFSKKILFEYGIGFILSDWLFKDTDGKVKVKFNPNYLFYWYHDTNNNPFSAEELGQELYNKIVNPTDVIDDEIYSFANCFTYYFYTDNQNIALLYGPETSIEGRLKNYAVWSYNPTSWGCSFINDAEYYKFLNSRIYIGTNLYKADNYSQANAIITHPTVKSTEFRCVLYNISPNRVTGQGENPAPVGADLKNNCVNSFLIYSFDYVHSLFHTIEEFWSYFEQTNPLKYDLIAQWTINEPYRLYFSEGSTGHNEYKPGNADTSFQDYVFLKQAHWNDGSDIIKEKLAVEITGIVDDIVVDESKLDWYRKTNIEKSFSRIDYDIKVTEEPNPNQELTDFFNSGLEGYQTPSQYYASHNIEVDDGINDPLSDDKNIATRIWFWLDTLKNWCMYTRNDHGYLYLQCWDGLGNWDRVETIVWAPDWEKKIKYHYLPDFFREHVRYPGEGSHAAWTPIRIGSDIGRMYYDSIILTKDTKLYNYNNNFQSMHNSKLYPQPNWNQMANTSFEESKTVNNHTVPRYEDIQYALSIDTQYNPCIIKLINGDVALVHVMLIEGNSQNGTHYIITPDLANKKCKEIFGDGSDKTIENDWKRIHHDFDWTEEKASKIVTDPNQLITGAPNLTRMAGSSTINSIKFFANRPNPTTNNLPGDDFVERWK